jgi:molybdopterin/thiamine biosynthesis adenylyltransferase/rhodanese-related sulfurtransferase
MSINPPPFTSEERERYSRHLLLPEVGFSGQERLKAARILVVGAGGLGSPAALYLAAAGIGTLGIVDNDTVELSNLQRQILHTTDSVGGSKVLSAVERLSALNPHVIIQPHATLLSRDNALEILQHYDIIIDGTDNFATRYLVNDACGLLRKPLVYGSVFRFTGQVSVFDAAKGGCYRCLYPTPPPPHLVPNCAEGGVLGVLPGIIGTLQAAEALKIVLDIGETLHRRLLLVDALTMQFSTFTVPHNPHCTLCGSQPTITELQDYETFCNPFSPQSSTFADEWTAEEVRQHLGEITLIDVREAHERLISVIDGSLHIPLGDVAARISEIRVLKRPIVFHCASGKRSAEALNIAQQNGIEALHLKGGINVWK